MIQSGKLKNINLKNSSNVPVPFAHKAKALSLFRGIVASGRLQSSGSRVYRPDLKSQFFTYWLHSLFNDTNFTM